MYIPRINQETDLNTLQEFMIAYNFAVLVNHHDNQLDATHLPLMLDRTRGAYGTLVGHLARANKQWKTFGDSEVMVIFNGPHAYISPTWYDNHPSVPTWNYVTVHAYGVPHIIEEQKAIDEALHQLVKNHEQNRDPEWIMDLPTDFMDTMRKAIVAFEIEITRLEGKFKLSQNKTESEKQTITRQLLARGYSSAVSSGKLMAQHVLDNQ